MDRAALISHLTNPPLDLEWTVPDTVGVASAPELTFPGPGFPPCLAPDHVMPGPQRAGGTAAFHGVSVLGCFIVVKKT